MIYEVFSSGGVGDALIVGLKIQQAVNRLNPSRVIWRHFEKHQCHQDACLAIQDKFAEAECYILDTPERAAKEMCYDLDGTYLDTKINQVMNPYLNGKLSVMGFFNEKLLSVQGYIVVQMQAGRMNDGTRRIIGQQVINELLDGFPNKDIVLVGPESTIYENDRVINLTGQTNSIIDVLEIINDCSIFIGQDGVLSYYAMMLRKYTIVNYHMPGLVGHYWNNKWGAHSLALVGGGNNLRELPKIEQVAKFLSYVKEST